MRLELLVAHDAFGQIIPHARYPDLLGLRHIRPARQQMFAQDFAFFAGQVPGYFVLLGSQLSPLPSAPPPFSCDFNPDERSISLGTKIMCHLILGCLEQQESWENRRP